RIRSTHNPLFAINTTMAMTRDNLGRLRRRSWLVTKVGGQLQNHLALFTVYRNYVRRRFNRDKENETPAQILKLLPRRLRNHEVVYDAADDIVPLATPVYAAEGCEGPRYRSIVVTRADRPWRTLDDLRGARAAINEASSHSGTNALRSVIAPLSRDGAFFGDV